MRRESLQPSLNPQRILIIKPSALGDVATTLPLLCDVKRAYPGAEIDWLIHPSLVALVEGHDAVHEVIRFDRKRLASWWWKPSSFSLFRGLLGKLRGRRYDLVIDAQGLFRSGFLARVTGARVRVGFADAREFAGRFYTHRVELPEGGAKMVAVDRMRALAGPLGIDIRGAAEFRMPVRGERGVVPGANFPAGSAYVVVIPGARWNTKRWDADRYAEVVRQLMAAGERVVLLGSPDERELCERIAGMAGASGEGLVNVAGKTNLAEMIAILAGAKLVIGNDSGPLHVAVALGRRTVSVYGPTSPAYVGPFGQMENVVRHDVPCHPCRNRECDHHSCMKGVQVELVWEKAAGLLSKERQRR